MSDVQIGQISDWWGESCDLTSLCRRVIRFFWCFTECNTHTSWCCRVRADRQIDYLVWLRSSNEEIVDESFSTDDTTRKVQRERRGENTWLHIGLCWRWLGRVKHEGLASAKILFGHRMLPRRRVVFQFFFLSPRIITCFLLPRSRGELNPRRNFGDYLKRRTTLGYVIMRDYTCVLIDIAWRDSTREIKCSNFTIFQ